MTCPFMIDHLNDTIIQVPSWGYIMYLTYDQQGTDDWHVNRSWLSLKR